MINGIFGRYLFAGLVLLAVTAGCVKIETGPETREQRTETSTLRARDFRVNWAGRFDPAEPARKADMLKNLVDTLSIRYINYGQRVVDEWSTGNAGRGTEIPDSEMREVVAQWNESEMPMLEAYEEVIEYSINDIKRTNHFDAQVLELFDRNIEMFYKVNSAVFYPSGTVDDYSYNLGELNADFQELSLDLGQELERYF